MRAITGRKFQKEKNQKKEFFFQESNDDAALPAEVVGGGGGLGDGATGAAGAGGLGRVGGGLEKEARHVGGVHLFLLCVVRAFSICEFAREAGGGSRGGMRKERRG